MNYSYKLVKKLLKVAVVNVCLRSGALKLKKKIKKIKQKININR